MEKTRIRKQVCTNTTETDRFRSSLACRAKIKAMESEVLTELNMKITDFLDMKPCSLNDTHSTIPNIRDSHTTSCIR